MWGGRDGVGSRKGGGGGRVVGDRPPKEVRKPYDNIASQPFQELSKYFLSFIVWATRIHED